MSESKRRLMGLREFARYRGVGLRAVQKAIEGGRITPTLVNGRRMIDPEAASAEWDAKTRAAASTRPPTNSEDQAQYHQSRSQKEYYLSELARLDYEARMGELLAADEVRATIQKLVGEARDRLLNIPD